MPIPDAGDAAGELGIPNVNEPLIGLGPATAPPAAATGSNEAPILFAEFARPRRVADAGEVGGGAAVDKGRVRAMAMGSGRREPDFDGMVTGAEALLPR